MKINDEKAIETLQLMLDSECLVVGDMESRGEEDIDRRPLQSLAYAITAMRERGLIRKAHEVWLNDDEMPDILLIHALTDFFEGSDTALKRLAREE